MMLPTHDDVQAARFRIAGQIVHTPMLRHSLLDEITGARILLKPETLQRTGSFKLRGASNAILKLDAAERRAGVVTHSSGNHGQATACAAAGIGAVGRFELIHLENNAGRLARLLIVDLALDQLQESSAHHGRRHQ